MNELSSPAKYDLSHAPRGVLYKVNDQKVYSL